MADPTLVLTYDDYRIRVAEFLGIASYGAGGTGAAAIPTDTHDLDVVSRLVADGYRRFITERDWKFLTPTFDITFVTGFSGTVTAGGNGTTTIRDSSRTEADDFFNTFLIKTTSATDGSTQVRTVSDYDGTTNDEFTVSVAFSPAIAVGDTYETAAATAVDGENYRYFMPDDFYGEMVTSFTYPTNGPLMMMVETTEFDIRTLRAAGLASGPPIRYALRPINTTETTTAQRYEVLTWPTPNLLTTVTGSYRRFPAQFSTGTNRSVAGYQHDETVLKAAIAEAELQRDDKQGEREASYQVALAKSVDRDRHTATKRIRDYGDKGEDRFDIRTGFYNGVEQVGTTAIDLPG